MLSLSLWSAVRGRGLGERAAEGRFLGSDFRCLDG